MCLSAGNVVDAMGAVADMRDDNIEGKYSLAHLSFSYIIQTNHRELGMANVLRQTFFKTMNLL